MKTFLNVYRPESVYPERIDLVEGESVFAGAATSCRVKLTGDSVTQYHCMFTLGNGVVNAQSCDPNQPIMLNDQWVDDEVNCLAGDTIVIGEFRMVVSQTEILAEDVVNADNVVSANPEMDPDGAVESKPGSRPMLGPVAQSIAVGDSRVKVAVETELNRALNPAQLANGSCAISEFSPIAECFTDDIAQDDGSVATDKLHAISVNANDADSDATSLGEAFVLQRETTELEASSHMPSCTADESNWNVDWKAQWSSDGCVDETTADRANHAGDVGVSNEQWEAELELLRSEVEYLQNELSARDVRTSESVSQTVGNAEDMMSVDESLRLVNRLESLLEELQRSDERVKSLEDCLRASDEANQAEREERLQVEVWLGEVESRVQQRESESAAQIQQLKNQCAGLAAGRHKAESQLEAVLAQRVNSVAPADAVNQHNEETLELQQTITQLQRLLESERAEKELAVQQLASTNLDDQAREMDELRQKLMQIELDTSRERAHLARQRADLEIELGKLERQAAQTTRVGDNDFRFAAMRDHLREIHEQERLSNLEKKQNSLSSRIARLLSR